MDAGVNVIKVFSTTKHKGRDSIGQQVTTWIADNPSVRIVKTFVALTSDERFHCFSIVLVCVAP